MQEPPFVSGDASPSPTINLPDFGTQNYDIPPMMPYDLTGPGMTYVPAFADDPTLPDLDKYTQPDGLDLSLQSMDADPQLASDVPTPSEITASLYPGLGFSTLDVQRNMTDADPLVPDLQYPDLTQQVQMPTDERPGNLDPSALDVLHATLSYRQASASTYPDAWMDQRGMNTTRSRHLSLLNDGFER